MEQLKPFAEAAIAYPIATGIGALAVLALLYWVFGGIIGRIFRVRNLAAHMFTFLIVLGIGAVLVARDY
ncbi:MAG: hypothetical protein AAFT19_10180, partial [Pseudomonadota bacterium]